MTLTTLPSAAPVCGQRHLAASRSGSPMSSCSPAATSCTSRASRCSSPTSPMSRCCSRCCSSTCSAPGSSCPAAQPYTDFAITGLFALNLTTSAMGTAVGLSNDLNSGVHATASGRFPCGEPPSRRAIPG